MFRANNFDKLLDKATSNLRLDPDWPTILQICDLIRQNDCSPKYAVAAVKKKLYSQNPHQAMFSLLTLESIVKNCGSGIHDEVTSKPFCEMLRDLVKTTPHENLRTKILELIQAWAYAFRNAPKYRSVQDTVNILKAEGFKFPTLKESDAMFSADTAPEWADGEVCHRCRVAFSLMVRRHHCRACGQVFCQQCSSKTSTLPKFGIEKEVRVCDACYDKVSRPPPSTAKLEIVDTANDYGPIQPQKRPPGGKTAEELQEEEELQLALALSQSEAEHKEKERRPPVSHLPAVSPSPSSVSASPEHGASTELSRYLDRTYWEQRVARDGPTAPAPASHASHDLIEQDFPKAKAQDDDENEDKEVDEFVESLKSQVEIFVNRMKSNSSRGRSIANDTAVQSLFMNITAMHSRLLKYIQQQDDKRVYLESLQDKVTQIRDSRAALDTLRAEHAARLAAAAEAAERTRQLQMATKLQAMRKKKHEYLQYQRQLALHKVQEQEREMQMRQEQQKHQYLMSANSYYMPGAPLQQYQSGYPNQAMYGNPQFHPQMMPQATTDGTINAPGQTQMSQAAMQMGPMSQSMPQLPNSFPMTSSGAPVSQTISAQATMNQPNIRQTLGQQMPMQQQMLMQQMHQMRMPVQPGVHQISPQNMPNGLPQQNGQTSQMSKQNLPNQPQQTSTNSMMPSMSVAQQNMGQPMMNPSTAMLGMQMQNMRMPQMQGSQSNPNQQVPVSGYMNYQNQQSSQQPGSQPQSIQQPSQHIPGQQMSMPSQSMALGGQQMIPGQPQGMSMPSHMPPTSQGQQASQSQGQNQIIPGQSNNPGQSIQPPGQMMMQGQQIPPGQNIPQGQTMLHQQMNPNQLPPGSGQQMMPGQQMGQQMQPNQMQQLPQVPQQLGGQVQHLPTIPQGQPLPQSHTIQQVQSMQPGQPMPQGQQVQPGQPMLHGQQLQQGQPMLQGQQIQQGQPMPQGQPMLQGQQLQQGQPMTQGQQMQQGQPMPQNMPGQPMKMQQPNFGNLPQQQPSPNQQGQPPQTPVKSETTNSTAELINFD